MGFSQGDARLIAWGSFEQVDAAVTECLLVFTGRFQNLHRSLSIPNAQFNDRAGLEVTDGAEEQLFTLCPLRKS